jgi:diaminopimelate epimerase
MRFTKMHGCGNDYVYLDGFRATLPPLAAIPALARQLSNRHTGIGSDGLIIVAPPETGSHVDARMLMWNSDGSSSEMCGNGIRCAAKLAHDHGHVPATVVRFATGAGLRVVTLHGRDGNSISATVAMGRPQFAPRDIPVLAPGTGNGPVLLELPAAGATTPLRIAALGMGNPHAVTFVDDPDDTDVARIGAQLERHPLFPRRTNVEFVARTADSDGIPVLRQRTWERGAGETQACGTGACATTVAAIRLGQIHGREAIVRLNGGDLRIVWPSDDAEVQMTGPATTVFEGDY